MQYTSCVGRIKDKKTFGFIPFVNKLQQCTSIMLPSKSCSGYYTISYRNNKIIYITLTFRNALALSCLLFVLSFRFLKYKVLFKFVVSLHASH